MSRSRCARYRVSREPVGGDMSQLIGAETRRVDAVAERLNGYSQGVQDLRTMAQRAVIEMRNAWGGGDFEHIARSWEREAGPRLGEAASSLTAMVLALRAQSAEQRRVSGNTGQAGCAASLGFAGFAGGAGHVGVASGTGGVRGDSSLVGGATSAGGEWPTINRSAREASLVSVRGGNENYQYEISAGKVEATADSFVDVDGHGNLAASAGASAAAYLGYAAGGAHAGNDAGQVSAYGQAFVGAAAGARASGLIGVGGAAGHVGGEAFAGAKAAAGVSGTIAGATAAVGAEISYGIGAHADLDAELSATRVGVAVDVGAALGLGAGVKLDVSVNPQELIEVVANIDHVFA